MMKKILLLMFAMLAIGSSAFSKDVLYVDDFTLSNKNKTALVIRMDVDGKSTVQSFGFFIKLPEGVEFVKDGNDFVPYISSNLDIPSFDAKLQDDGTLKVGVSARTIIKGAKQVVMAFKIQTSLSAGQQLKGQLIDPEESKLKDGDQGTELIELDDNEFTMTVTDRVVLDENSPFAPEATGGNVDILVKRTITANQWSTICLPFDIDKDIFKSIFGSDVQLAAFDSYTYEAESDELSVIFTNDDLSEGFYAGYPYLIKTTQDISEFNLTATISVASEISETWEKGKGSSKKVGKFWGTYSADCVVPENDLFISDNQFYYSIGTTRMKAFRGYFEFTDILANPSKASTRAIINIGDGTTGIRNAKLEGEETGKVYSMTGQYMGERESLKSLPKGVYIIDGKKVINK